MGESDRSSLSSGSSAAITYNSRITNDQLQNQNSQIESFARLLGGLGSTGSPSAPKETTITMYVSPSVSPVSVRSVLLVVPPLSLLLIPADAVSCT